MNNKIMNIRVHLYGELKERYLPSGKTTICLKHGTTIKELALILKMPIDDIVVALVNGRAEKMDYKITENSRIDLFPILKGG